MRSQLYTMAHEVKITNIGRRHGCIYSWPHQLFLLGSLCFQYLLDNLAFLDQEGTDDTRSRRVKNISIHNNIPRADTRRATRTTICTLHSLLWLGDASVFLWTQRWNAIQSIATITAVWNVGALLQVAHVQLAAWCLHHSHFVGLGVV